MNYSGDEWDEYRKETQEQRANEPNIEIPELVALAAAVVLFCCYLLGCLGFARRRFMSLGTCNCLWRNRQKRRLYGNLLLAR